MTLSALLLLACGAARSEEATPAPDGTAGTEGTVQPWLAATPKSPGVKPVRVLGDPAFWLTAPISDGTIAVSRDGTVVAIGDRHGRLSLLNARTGAVLGEHRGHGDFSAVTFSGPRRLVTATETLQIWDLDVARADQVRPVDLAPGEDRMTQQHAGAVSTLVASESVLVTVDVWGGMAVWDVASRKLVNYADDALKKRDSSYGPDFILALSPDGAHVAVGERGSAVSVWSTATLTEVARVEWEYRDFASANSVVFLDATRMRVSGSLMNGTVVATDWSIDGTLIKGHKRPMGPGISWTALSPSGTRVAVQDDEQIRIWDIATDSEMDLPGDEYNDETFSFSDTGDYLVFGGDPLQIVGLDPFWSTPQPDYRSWTLGEMAPDGTAVLGGYGGTFLWNAEGELKDLKRDAESLVLDATGKHLAGYGDSIWMMNLPTRRVLFEQLDTLGYVAPSLQLDQTTDGSWLVAETYGHGTVLMNAKNGDWGLKLEASGTPRFNSDGTQLAMASTEELFVVDRETGKVVHQQPLPLESSNLSTQVVGWAGDRVVLMDLWELHAPGEPYNIDQILVLVDPATGEWERVGTSAEWGASTVSPDGRLLTSSDEFGGLWVHDLKTGKTVEVSRTGPSVRDTDFDATGALLLVARGLTAEIYRVEDVFSTSQSSVREHP